MKILPLVWDTYGAPGVTAAATICKLAKGVAQRFDLSITRVISMLRKRLAARIICSIGDIAAEAGWRIHNARPLCRSSTAFGAVADCGKKKGTSSAAECEELLSVKPAIYVDTPLLRSSPPHVQAGLPFPFHSLLVIHLACKALGS